MSYPETRPDGSPLVTEMNDAIRGWFCRSGVILEEALRLGIVTEAQILALWNLRDDRLTGLQCGELTAASFRLRNGAQ